MSDEFLTTLDESTNLYKKYQMAIHNDEPEECDKTSFLNFLVKSPLKVYYAFYSYYCLLFNIFLCRIVCF